MARTLILLLCWPAANTLAQGSYDPDRLLLEAFAPGTDVALSPETVITADARDSFLPDREEMFALISSHEARIEATSLAGGEFSDELVPTLQALSETLQRQGRHEEALEHLSRATYINRMNHGFEYAGNIPLYESMVTSHLALGELEEARDRERNLMSLMRTAPGIDMGDRAALNMRLAEQNMDTFRTILYADIPPTISISFNGSGRSPSPREQAFTYLFQARSRYMQGIMQLMGTEGPSSPLLAPLEEKHIETIYLTAHRRSLMAEPDFYMGERHRRFGSSLRYPETQLNTQHYYSGKAAWQRMLVYYRNQRDIPVNDLIEALMQQADWEMLYRRNAKGLDSYKAIYASLKESGMTENALEAWFNPAIPEQLPSFTALPHSREKHGIAPDQQVSYDGYLEVKFSISRYGRISNVRVLETSGDVPDVVISRLKKQLMTYPARPRFSGGERVRKDGTQVRYYYAFLDTE